MELYIDSADLQSAQKLIDYYPVDGLTTNPQILADSDFAENESLLALRDFVKKNKIRIFVQVTGNTAEEMQNQALQCKNYFGYALIIKVPAIKEGYRAVRLCRENGIEVCVTVVHSTLQAYIAAKAGAGYVAPYISHIDNMGGDGVNTVREIRSIFEYGNYSCKVLGASFRTADQIKRLASVGCEAVTIRPEMFDTLIAHAATDVSMEKFRSVWRERFGNCQVVDLLTE